MSKATGIANVKDFPDHPAWSVMKNATTDAERYAAGQYVTEPVPFPDLDKPAPRFFADLPWPSENGDATADIMARLASADDLEAATDQQSSRKPSDTLGQPVTVLGVQARRSDIEDSTWGACVALTVSVDGGPPEVMFSGSPEVCVVAWRRYVEGKLPFSGEFVGRGQKKAGRNQAVGFRLVEAF